MDLDFETNKYELFDDWHQNKIKRAFTQKLQQQAQIEKTHLPKLLSREDLKIRWQMNSRQSVMPSSTIFRQHTRLNAATNKTTKKISHTRRSPKDRNYPSTPFDKLPFYFKYRLPTNLRFIRNPLKFNICINCFKVFLTSQNLSPFMRT